MQVLPVSQSSLGTTRVILFRGVQFAAANCSEIRWIAWHVLATTIDESLEAGAVAAVWVQVLNVVFIVSTCPLQAIGSIAGPRLFGRYDASQTPETIDAVRDLYRNGLFIALMMSPLVTGLLGSSAWLRYTLSQDESIAIAVRNLSVRCIPMMLLTVISTWQMQMLMAAHKASALWGSFGFLILGLMLSAAFSLGIGVPKYGLSGIIFGGTTELISVTALYFLSLHTQTYFQPFQFLTYLFRSLKNNGARFKTLLYQGSLIFFILIAKAIFSLGMQSVSGRLGHDAQNLTGILMTCLLANTIIIVNFALAGATLLGKAVETERDAVLPIVQHTQCIVVSIGAVIPLFIAYYPDTLLSLFHQKNPDMQRMMHSVAPLAAGGILFDAMCMPVLLSTRILGDATISSVIRSIGFLMIIGSAIMLTTLNYGIEGINLSFCVGMLFTALALIARSEKIFEPYRIIDQSQASYYQCAKQWFWKKLRKDTQQQELAVPPGLQI